MFVRMYVCFYLALLKLPFETAGGHAHVLLQKGMCNAFHRFLRSIAHTCLVSDCHCSEVNYSWLVTFIYVYIYAFG